MKGKTIDQISVGDKDSFTKTITETDVYTFAGVTGDLNPAHVNKTHAQKTFFKKRIAHGMLVSSLISTVLGMKFPGPGTIYISQNLTFTAPVYYQDTVTAEVEVIERDEEKNRIKLKTLCKNQNDKVVVNGEAVVMPPKK